MKTQEAQQVEILKFFYEEGLEELTPSYVAYRLQLSSGQAASLLDTMVRESVLELSTDPQGRILYQLPSVERDRLARVREGLGRPHRPQPSPRPHSSHPPHHRQGGSQGEDGSAWGGTSSGGGEGYQHARQRPPKPGHHPAPPWAFPPGPQPPPQGPQQQRPPGWPPQHHSQPGHPIGGDGGAMVPYGAGQHQPPVVYGHYYHRPPNPHHSPGIAALLSFFFPGFGQFYNGEASKGVTMMVTTAMAWLFLMGWAVHVWSIIDAYNQGQKIQQGS